ncbi:MAG TPA: 2-dehydropantoate 2-reductase [Candidatus Dormibacteraeota bacterium]
MRIAIVGAGATGGYLGACLARAGADVVLVARGPHLAAMRERGLTVREPDGSSFITRPQCTDDLAAAVGSAQVVFLTLKAHSLPGVAPELGAALRPGAIAVFAQNGIPWWYAEGLQCVDPGGLIAAHVPRESVLGCVVYPATSLLEPGVVEHVEGNRFSLGEPDGGRSERAAEIGKALISAGLKAPVSTRIRQEIWLKLLGNATFNPVSALTRATLGQIGAAPQGRDLIRALMEEVDSVATAESVAIDIGIERRMEAGFAVGEHKTSMLQDLEAGRPLEIDALVGAVCELGDRHRLPLPHLRTVYGLAILLKH